MDVYIYIYIHIYTSKACNHIIFFVPFFSPPKVTILFFFSLNVFFVSQYNSIKALLRL